MAVRTCRQWSRERGSERWGFSEGSGGGGQWACCGGLLLLLLRAKGRLKRWGCFRGSCYFTSWRAQRYRWWAGPRTP